MTPFDPTRYPAALCGPLVDRTPAGAGSGRAEPICQAGPCGAASRRIVPRRPGSRSRAGMSSAACGCTTISSTSRTRSARTCQVGSARTGTASCTARSRTPITRSTGSGGSRRTRCTSRWRRTPWNWVCRSRAGRGIRSRSWTAASACRHRVGRGNPLPAGPAPGNATAVRLVLPPGKWQLTARRRLSFRTRPADQVKSSHRCGWRPSPLPRPGRLCPGRTARHASSPEAPAR